MSALSNIARRPSPPQAPDRRGIPPIGIRQAREEELPTAVRLALSSTEATIAEWQIDDFVNLARTATAAAGGVWIAGRDEQALVAVLPLVSAGKTMLLFLSSPDGAMGSLLTRLALEACCHRAAQSGIVLAQALVDPRASASRDCLESAGFSRLAELIYLQVRVPGGESAPALPAGMKWLTYSPQTHAAFADAILSVYSQSLDCPVLNGVRQIDDVIEGHKATGEFDPRRWLLLCRDERPQGLLLLNAVPRSDAMEVVYLGVTPDARQRGLGEILMRQAIAITSASPQPRLTLAVDAANAPALRLYWRHGMQTVCRRLAMMRDLRNLSTFHPQGG